DPAARFQSAEEMRAGLLAVDPDNAEATPPAGLTLAAATPPRRGTPRLLVAGLAALLFLSVAVIVRSGGGDGAGPADPARKPGLAAPAGGALADPKGLPAHSFDPFGDDKAENEATVGNVSDGDPNTVWFTSLPQIEGSYKVEVSEITVDNS